MKSEIIAANIEVHSIMAESYNRLEPHFRPENQAKVRGVLRDLAQRCQGGKMLDLGCGTGFILNLAREFFSELHGVDITQAMLDQVDMSSGKIKLHNTPAESLPFANDTFDLVTAYSFIHHAENPLAILREAGRVLKPGGICYVDLEPNKLFWNQLSQLEEGQLAQADPILQKAHDSVLHTDDKVSREFGIPQDTFNKAEYGKAVLGGIDPYEIRSQTHILGFKSCAVRFEWYLGQAEAMHGQSFEAAALIEAHLRRMSPLSDHLFKYVQLIFTK